MADGAPIDFSGRASPLLPAASPAPAALAAAAPAAGGGVDFSGRAQPLSAPAPAAPAAVSPVAPVSPPAGQLAGVPTPRLRPGEPAQTAVPAATPAAPAATPAPAAPVGQLAAVTPKPADQPASPHPVIPPNDDARPPSSILKWEPAAKERSIERINDALKNATPSQPGANGPLYPQTGVSPGGPGIDPVAMMVNFAQGGANGLQRGGKDFSQTAQTLGGATPDYEPPPPEEALPDFSDINAGSRWLGYQLAKAAPATVAAAGTGAVLSYFFPAAGVVSTAVATGGVFGALSFLQTLGPIYAQKIASGMDKAQAYDEAMKEASRQGVVGAFGGFLFGMPLFKGVLPTILAQSLVVQPAVTMAARIEENVRNGKDPTDGLGDTYVQTAAGTILPIAVFAGAKYLFMGSAGKGPPQMKTATPEQVNEFVQKGRDAVAASGFDGAELGKAEAGLADALRRQGWSQSTVDEINGRIFRPEAPPTEEPGPSAGALPPPSGPSAAAGKPTAPTPPPETPPAGPVAGGGGGTPEKSPSALTPEEADAALAKWRTEHGFTTPVAPEPHPSNDVPVTGEAHTTAESGVQTLVATAPHLTPEDVVAIHAIAPGVLDGTDAVPGDQAGSGNAPVAEGGEGPAANRPRAGGEAVPAVAQPQRPAEAQTPVEAAKPDDSEGKPQTPVAEAGKAPVAGPAAESPVSVAEPPPFDHRGPAGRAQDLATDKTVDQLVAEQDRFEPRHIASGVQYGLDYKKLTASNAIKALDLTGIEQPTTEETTKLLREGAHAGTMSDGSKKLIFNGTPDKGAAAWATIHAINHGYLKRVGQFLHVTPEGLKVIGAGKADTMPKPSAAATSAALDVEQKKPKPKPTTPADKKWTEIGKNKDGATLYEDPRGVRSIIEGNVRRTEPVGLIPRRDGGHDISVNHKDEYLTAAEHAAQEKPAPAAKPEASAPVAKPTATPAGPRPKGAALQEWWDGGLTTFGRRQAVEAAGFTGKAVDTIAKTSWLHLSPENQEVLEKQYVATITREMRLAEAIATRIADGEILTMQTLLDEATVAYGGTSAEGKYDRKDAYDAMELAVNLAVSRNPALRVDDGEWEGPLQKLSIILNHLPTQTVRSEEQVTMQQFSTPPHYAAAAVYAAALSDGDVVMEPSAGTGSLVAAAMRPKVEIVANELSERRVALLRGLIGDRGKVTAEDAEQLNNILPASIKPTVVVMNPPFSRAGARMGDKVLTQTGANHIEQALKRLEPGGRLVAIVGQGMGMEAPTFKDFWNRVSSKYSVRANIAVFPEVYKKYGTSFGTRLLVIDKVAPVAGEKPLVRSVDALSDLFKALEPIRNARPAAKLKPAEHGGVALAEGGEGAGGPVVSPRPVAGPVGPGPRGAGGLPVEPAPRGGGAGGAPAPVVGEGRPGVPVLEPGGGGGPAGAGGATAVAGGELGNGAASGGVRPKRDLQPAAGGDIGPATSGERIALEQVEPGQQSTTEITDSLYEAYKPQRVRIAGAKDHPGPLVQSAAMASVEPPNPTYQPSLPKEVITAGKLSLAQLEAVIYTGQAHQKMLPAGEGEVAKRRGHFIGDGTGVGKGREIAGIILDNWQQGRTKAVWVSEKKKLLHDAKRDWSGLGQDDKVLFDVGKTKTGEPITAGRGIAFVTYDTLKGGMSDQASLAQGGFIKGQKVRINDTESEVYGQTGVVKGKGKIPGVKGSIWSVTLDKDGSNYTGLAGNIDSIGGQASVKSRVDQLVDWFGEDFDGVIAFDEAHNMGNVQDTKAARGTKEAALKALAGMELQNRLPNARVVYVSATGATEVANLAYADRLGLWGRGTPFADRNKFIGDVERGGIAAMELIARDMKQLGLYTARNLSYDGVEYGKVEHPLTKDQKETYDQLAEAWQIVLQNINAALEVTGGEENAQAKSAAYSAFWGSHQRFFNQIITSMQMPSVIKAIAEDLAEGRQVVLQLTNTNEAAQNRAAAKATTAEEIENLDITPRDSIIQLIEKSFPTQQYEEQMDDSGNIKTVAVTDSEGNPVQNAEAVAMREELIDKLASIRVPQGPLDLILDHFGTDNVAEVTGRKRRFVLEPDESGQKRRVEQSRPGSANQNETNDFQAGTKHILVFSDAGGTGASYHADNSSASKNARRSHYLLQAGWIAAKAVQGFGRSHRTNQASAPIFKLVTTDLKGQKRFISSIARRLAQLGALTKGERKAGDQGVFSARDNLESDEATKALDQFYNDLLGGRIEAIRIDDFENQTGLKLRIESDDGDFTGVKQDLPPINQFLNRLLSLRFETQNAVFDAFSSRMDAIIEERQQAGTLDVGLETIRADKIDKVSEQSVHVNEEGGAPTKYVELRLGNRFKPIDFDSIDKNSVYKTQFYAKSPTGKIYVVKEGPDKTDAETGTVMKQYRLVSTMPGQHRTINRENIDKYGSSWVKIDETKAREMWADETAKAPEFVNHDLHLITGAILPVWDRLKGNPRVVRLQTDAGERFIGRVIPPEGIGATLKALGAEVGDQKLDLSHLAQKILTGSKAVLANGWTLSRALVAAEYRIELVGPSNGSEAGQVQRDGVFSERINYQNRYFVPTEPEEAAKVIGRLTEFRPITDLIAPAEPKAPKGKGKKSGFQEDVNYYAKPPFPSRPVGTERSPHNDLGTFPTEGSAPLAEQAQHAVVGLGKRNGVEFVAAFGPTGKTVAWGYGTRANTGTSPAMEKAFDDPLADVVVHHNHPSSTSLSVGDVGQLARPGVTAVLAHGHTGNVFYGALTPAARALKLNRDQLHGLAHVTQLKVYDVIDRMLDARGRDAGLVNQANAATAHIVNQILAGAGLIDYRHNVDFSDFIADAGLGEYIQRWTAALARTLFHDEQRGLRLGQLPPQPLRHIAAVGTVFDRGAVAALEYPRSGGGDPSGRAADRAKEGQGREDQPTDQDSALDEVMRGFDAPGLTYSSRQQRYRDKHEFPVEQRMLLDKTTREMAAMAEEMARRERALLQAYRTAGIRTDAQKMEIHRAITEYQENIASTPPALSPLVSQFYRDHYEPLFELHHDLYVEAQAYRHHMDDAQAQRFADAGDPEYVHHVARGKGGRYDRIAGDMGANPGVPRRALPISAAATKPVVFYALENQYGHRVIVKQNSDGTIGELRYKQSAGNPRGFLARGALKIDDVVKSRNGQQWTVRRAKLAEKQAHVTVPYYENVFATTMESALALKHMVLGLAHFDELIRTPEWSRMAVRRGSEPPPAGWKEIDRAPLRGWYLHPDLWHPYKDFYEGQPLFDVGDTWGGKAISAVNRLAIGSLFISPIPHALNVAAHWFVDRGWDWLSVPGYVRLAVTGVRAWHAIATRSDVYLDLLKSGAPLFYSSAKNNALIQHVFDRTGAEMEADPPGGFWHIMAKATGFSTVSAMVKAYYRAVNRSMWALGDWFMVQRIMEYQQRSLLRGRLSEEEAITRSRKHIPDYVIPPKVLRSRNLSRLMQDTLVGNFGRYTLRKLGTFFTIANELFGLKGGIRLGERGAAMGHLLMLWVGASVVKPVLDAMVQFWTNRKDAEFGYPGPFGVINSVNKAIAGKITAAAFLQGTYTTAPFINFAMGSWQNADPWKVAMGYRDPSIRRPKDTFMQAMWHEAVFAASQFGLVSDVERSYGKAGPVPVIGQQFGVRTP